MSVIGIVGSRRRNTEADFILVEKAFQKLYQPGDRIVSGACPEGGDKFAEVLAILLAKPAHYDVQALLKMEPYRRHHIIKETGAAIIIHHADWKRHGRGAGFLRNGDIARDADLLIACVAADRQGGTEDTIGKFLQKGKTSEDVFLV